MPIDIDEHIRAVFLLLLSALGAPNRDRVTRGIREGEVARPESTNTSDLLCLRNHHMSILPCPIAEFIHKKGTGGSSFMLLCSCLIFCCAYLFMIRLDAHIVKTFIHPPISWTELFSKKRKFLIQPVTISSCFSWYRDEIWRSWCTLPRRNKTKVVWTLKERIFTCECSSLLGNTLFKLAENDNSKKILPSKENVNDY